MISWKKPGLIQNDHPFYVIGVISSVLIGTFLTVLSAVSTMIADNNIQGELSLSDPLTIWLTTLYLLGVNTSVPAANWFADRFGYKTVYAAGILIFVISSSLASVSVNFFMIGSARLLEGLGAGFIFPLGLAIIVQNVSASKLPLAMLLYISSCFGAGFAIGLPLAGYLTQFYSWRYVFVVIAALGFICFIITAFIQEDTPQTNFGEFDTLGYISFVSFIYFLLIGLTCGPLRSTDEGWRSPYIIACFALALLALILTIAIERKHPNPILPLVLFHNHIYALACLIMFLLGMSLFASISTMMLYMINALFYEKFISGTIGAIYGIMLTVVTMLANIAIKKIPVSFISLIGLCILIASYFLNNILDWQTGPTQIIWILVLRGIALGLALGPTTIQALQNVPKELSNKGAVILTFFRQVGATYGGTIINLIIIKRQIFHAARFGEQANTQLPAFIETSRKIFYHYYSAVSDKGQESKQLATETIIRNIENQAFITAINDAMLLVGAATSFAAAALIFFSLKEWRKKKNRGSIEPHRF